MIVGIQVTAMKDEIWFAQGDLVRWVWREDLASERLPTVLHDAGFEVGVDFIRALRNGAGVATHEV
jgi:hypothetical protein